MILLFYHLFKFHSLSVFSEKETNEVAASDGVTSTKKGVSTRTSSPSTKVTGVSTKPGGVGTKVTTGAKVTTPKGTKAGSVSTTKEKETVSTRASSPASTKAHSSTSSPKKPTNQCATNQSTSKKNMNKVLIFLLLFVSYYTMFNLKRMVTVNAVIVKEMLRYIFLKMFLVVYKTETKRRNRKLIDKIEN